MTAILPPTASLNFSTLFALGAQEARRQQRRRHPRHPVLLPMCLRLTTQGEWLPALLFNLSSSGLLALVETRVLSAQAVRVGMCLHGLLFLEVFEGEEVELEVARVELRGADVLGVGCQLVPRAIKLS